LIAVGAGGTSTLTLSGYINVTNPPPPEVDFTAAPAVGLAPLNVVFTGLAIGATNYHYDFGDGGTGSSKDASHIYANAGTYSVTFTAIGPGGTNSLNKPGLIVVTNPPLPTIDFTAAPRAGFAPLTVYFTNLTSGATNFQWSFGDGQAATDKDPSHIFPNP